MASHGAAKQQITKLEATEEPKSAGLPKGVEHLHALHSKMATHLAGIEEHMAGLHEAHTALGEHLGLDNPGKATGTVAAPSEGEEKE